MVDILEASGARRPQPGLAATPTSTQSEAQIAQPGLDMAAALKKGGEVMGVIGEKLDKAATEDAYAAGLEKVGRDAEGNPTVERPPFAITHSDRAFEAGARAGLLSRYREDAQRGMLDIANQHQTDPAAFDAAARDYIKNFASSADPSVKPLARAEAEKFRQQHYLTIQNGAVKRQTGMAKDAILVQIDSTSNDIYALSRQGGTGTPEFKDAATRLEGLYDNLRNNPLFEVSNERAASEMRTTIDRARGFEAAGKVASIYDSQGEKAAQKWLIENIRDNPDLKITDSQRSGLIEIGNNTLAMRKGENKAKIDANRASATVLAKAMEDGKPLPQGAVDQAIETATKLGDVETAAKLLTSKQVYGRNEANRGLSDEERVRLATSAPAAPADVGGVITAAADRYGISRDYALRVAHIESRFDPNAINGGSKATGLFQFIPSTWKSFGAGQSALDPAANADAAMRFTVANRDQLRRSLRREPTEGELYLAHQQGAGGAAKLLAAPNVRAVDVVGERAVLGNGGTLDMTAGQFAQKWIRKVDGAGSAPMPSVPYTQQQLAANPYLAPTWLKSQLAGNRELIDSAKFVLSAASSSVDKGTLPDAQTLAGAIQIANQNPDKLGRDRDEVLAKIRGLDEADEAMRSGSAAGSLLVQDVMRRAQGAPIFVQMQAEATKAAIERGAKNLAERPWEEAARRGWAPGIPRPLDFSSVDAVRAGLDARLGVAQSISSRTGEQQSVLSPLDLSAVTSIWATGAPIAQQNLATGLAALPAEQFGMVMATKEMRDSLIGMSRSGDPAKMATAFSLMDAAQRRDPDGFNELYGRDVENRMATWLVRSQYMSAEQLAKEEARYNDPPMQKAREELRKTAMTATKKTTANDIAGMIGGSWLPFSNLGAPIMPGQAQRLVNEFREEYAAIFAEVGDEGKARELAAQRLGRVWGPSPANGGALMQFPPEKYAPTIQGSHDWIGKQLENDVRGALVSMGAVDIDAAEKYSGAFPRDPKRQDVISAAATAMLDAPRMLVPDDKTAAEVSAGLPPSYPIVLKAPNGMFVPLQDGDGRQLRFRADHEAFMAPLRAEAEAEFERRRPVRDAQDAYDARQRQKAMNRGWTRKVESQGPQR